MFNSIQSLQYLFNATNGENWSWRRHRNISGNTWNFTVDGDGNYVQDPCLNTWQGICCTSNFIDSNYTAHCQGYLDEANITQFDLWRSTNSQIVGIVLPVFNMSGIIPWQLFSMTAVKLIAFPGNNLYGDLRPLQANLNLNYLNLEANLYSGHLNDSITLFSALWYLNLGYNKFSGPIACSITVLQNITKLYLNNNHLTQSIPSCLSSLSFLQELELTVNHLTGSFPVELAVMMNLEILETFGNYLTGILPINWTQPKMFILGMEQNMFSGSISNLIFNMPMLSELYFDFNYFIGPIPDDIVEMKAMITLVLANNYLSGPLLSTLYLLTNLGSVFLNNNALTGVIPSQIGFITTLSNEFTLAYNFITGNIPTEIGYLTNLILLQLNNNYITGSLPLSLSNMNSLEVLLLHSNLMTGQPGSCFDRQPLNTVDLCDNSFSGPVPTQIFHLRNLSTAALIRNCFSGTLPSDICAASSLTTLVLDGLATSQSCQLPLIFGTYTSQLTNGGTIPPCIFGMEQLVMLRLSGNQLTGSLPNCKLWPALSNLSLSHNALTGTIPAAFQNHRLRLLDLSFNKLSGTVEGMNDLFHNLQADLKGEVELDLQVNQLSGLLPPSFAFAKSINVVSGNLFGCSLHSGLPQHDPGVTVAQCGSGYLNQALYLWSSLFGVIILLAISLIGARRMRSTNRTGGGTRAGAVDMFLNSKSFSEKLAQQALVTVLPAALDVRLLAARYFHHLLTTIINLTGIFTLMILTIFLPFELVIKFVRHQEFATHTFQYAYTPSLGFIAGGPPAAIALMILVMFSIFVYLYMTALSSWLARHADESQLVTHTTTSRHTVLANSTWKRLERDFVVLVMFPLFDMAILFVANSIYLYVVFNYNTAASYSALCALVAFKLAWNVRFLPGYLRTIQHHYRHTKSFSPGISPGFLLGCLMLFNNIMVPCIVTLCTNPSCFLNVFVAGDSVEVVFQYVGGCAQYSNSGKCLHDLYGFIDLQYDPPFTYNYQCSSSALATYVPVFVIMYAYLAFISPVIAAAAPRLYGLAKNNKYLIFLLDTVCYPIMKSREDIEEMVEDNTENIANNIRDTTVNDITVRDTQTTRSSSSSSQLVNKIDMLLANSSEDLKLVNAEVITASFVCHMATLLTFGTAYPILAVFILVAVFMEAQQWKLLMGRYLLISHELPHERQVVMLRYLEASCAGVTGILSKSKWIMIVVMSLFYSFFLLDMTENRAIKVQRNVLWFPAVLLLWPAVVFVMTRLFKHYSRLANRHDTRSSSKAISMRMFGLTVLSRDTSNVIPLDNTFSSISPHSISRLTTSPIDHDLYK